MSRIEAIVSDFGGVLTSPLLHSFTAFAQRREVPLEALGLALARVAREEGENPLFELEKGALSEAAFLARVERALHAEVGLHVSMADFAEDYFAHLDPNEEMIAYMRELRGRGYRMAILTNNVREWETRWRAMLPVDEIFELVVDSAFVGMRKPDPAIFELTLSRLGVDARRTLFADDVEPNCEAARALGMAVVHYRDAEQAIDEIERRLRAHA